MVLLDLQQQLVAVACSWGGREVGDNHMHSNCSVANSTSFVPCSFAKLKAWRGWGVGGGGEY